MDRALLFWGVCIPLRTALAHVGDSGPLRVFAAVIGSRWVMGLENGDEGLFGGPAWWKEERPVHGALWLAYAGTGNARFLKADVAFGAANWLLSVPLARTGHLRATTTRSR